MWRYSLARDKRRHVTKVGIACAHVSSHMLRGRSADASADTRAPLLLAHVCSRMLTYAEVCDGSVLSCGMADTRAPLLQQSSACFRFRLLTQQHKKHKKAVSRHKKPVSRHKKAVSRHKKAVSRHKKAVSRHDACSRKCN